MTKFGDLAYRVNPECSAPDRYIYICNLFFKSTSRLCCIPMIMFIYHQEISTKEACYCYPSLSLFISWAVCEYIQSTHWLATGYIIDQTWKDRSLEMSMS